MGDNAEGSISGFIFQFQIALLELCQLNSNESISIEKIDDIGAENDKGTYIATIQAKHSLALTGTNFGSTSEDLWKTLFNWINKINDGKLNEKNKFIAITNKNVPSNSIINDFNNKLKSIDDIIASIDLIIINKEAEFDTKTKNGSGTANIEKILKWIKAVRNEKDKLEVIKNGFELRTLVDVQVEFLNKIYSGTLQEQKKIHIYEQYMGWIVSHCFEKWKNKEFAVISKEVFDKKFTTINGNPRFIEAIFRTKNELNLDTKTAVDNYNRNQLFITQINDIERFEKERIIQEAIVDFLRYEIELTYLITNKNGTEITKSDFEEFEKICKEDFLSKRLKYIKKEPSTMSEDELNDISISIFDYFMHDFKIEFKSLGFTDNDKYIQNGTLLKLTNVPTIGWHPLWEEKYKNNG